MNLLLVALEDQERIEDCLSALVELDVAGVQIVDSTSVMEALARQAPIFAGLRQLVSRPQAEGKLVLGLTERDDILPPLDALLKKLGVDLDAPGQGYAVLLPVTEAIGHISVEDD